MAQQPPQGPPWQPMYPQWPYQPPPGWYESQPPPRPSFPPPAPESPEKRRRRILIVVAIIVVGLTVQGIVLIRSFGQVRSAAGTADVHVPLAPNSAGDFKQGTGLIKTRVTILAIGGPPPTPNAPTTQITIDVLIENTGRLSISNEPWKLRGSDGQEYDPVFVAGVNNLPSRFRLSSGGHIQGTLVFQVPTDVTARWLRYGPHLPLNPNLYFDAP